MNLHCYGFGHTIEADSLGEAWLGLVETCIKNGNLEYDENRARFALHGVRVVIYNYGQPDEDPIIRKYANRESIASMRKLAFEAETMTDFDITPSFRNGAKSYTKRLEEGRMIDFVVRRLTRIPESKKAIMVFPTYEDYENVTNSPFNDYLPCIVSLQFRLHKAKEGGYVMNTHFFMRSQDAYQKNISDLVVFADIAHIVAKKLEQSLGTRVETGIMDGYITDAHVYKNTYQDAFDVLSAYLNQNVKA
jgi:thymidylate synthase